MPTSKHRVNITLDDDLYRALGRLSRRRRKSLSSVSLALIQKAIELEEDFHFSKQADERLERKERRVPHDKAWD